MRPEPVRQTVRAAALLLALAAAPAGAAPKEGAPLPGLWRYDTSFFTSSDSQEKCIGPNDIDKVLQGPSNRHYDCEYPVREVGGGKARFEGMCVNRKHGQHAQVALTGTYGPERFDLKGVVRADLGGLSIPVSASISAQRISPTCPAA